MTITEALNYVKRFHQEDASLRANWSDAELYALFEAHSNEACQNLGMIEGRDVATTIVSGTASYNYPSNFVVIRRIWYNGIPLKYLDFRKFENRRPSGVAPTGTPREFSLWNNVIYLIPTPSFSSGTPVLTIYGEKQQSAISTSSSTLDIPSMFHMSLCEAVIADMYAKDGNLSAAQLYQNKWLNVHLVKMREFAKRRRRIAMPMTTVDADSSLETEWGVI